LGLLALLNALFSPENAPAEPMGSTNAEPITRGEGFTWFLGAPVLLIVGTIFLGILSIVGIQATTVSSFSDIGDLDRSSKVIIWSTLAILICILVGVNFDLRINQVALWRHGAAVRCT
jgi:hypothetical protein